MHGVDWGDAPAWGAVIVAVLALIISAASAALAWKSLRWEKLSAEAAGRSAQEAERANRLTERALGLQALPTTRGGAEQQLDGAKPDVDWRIERPQGDRYVLRNTGTRRRPNTSTSTKHNSPRSIETSLATP